MSDGKQNEKFSSYSDQSPAQRERFTETFLTIKLLMQPVNSEEVYIFN